MTTADASTGAGSSPLSGEPGHRYLELTSITKRFGPTHALDGASLGVGRGEVHALFGGNGSGKSTMIKIMAGVYKADPHGQIRVGETVSPAGQWTPAAARAAGLRFVHQDLGLFPGMSVAENLALGNGYSRAAAGRIRWPVVRARAAAVLDRLEIPVGVSRIVGELRRGEQALVAIARALQDEDIAGHGVLVLDEPTASLPEHEVVGLMQALRRFAAQGTAIVYVSHRVEEVQEVADTITVLRDGVDILTTSAKSITKGELAEAITGAPAAAPAPQARPSTGAGQASPALQVTGLRGGPLRGVDLVVRAGEIVGIAGLLGSGRSSVLRALYGLGDDATGEIALHGRPLHVSSPAQAMDAGIGYLPEDRRDVGFFDQSVAENLSASRTAAYWRAGRFRREQERGDAREAIKRFRIRCESPRQLLSSLSGGNQQKVLVARVLLRKPEVVLLDEPTQGVDISAKAEIWGILRQSIAETGISVLVVSSDFEELAEYADRVLILARGRIVGEMSGPGMTSEMLARAAYGDEEKVGP
ncbi:MAG TPA: sugar ABC transporter ATP-binding protein [Trebonia sp.]|jgi:ribose transport system ATP-binding protein|nr:sugar ABC transporter ATP-binding protein [Trebonia sp.]